MFELNGQPVTLEQLQSDAAQYNATFEEYLEEMKKNGLVEKTNGSQIEDATAESNVTASEPVDFLSELQPAAQSSTAVVPSIGQSELNKFYSTAPTSPVVAYSKTENDKNIAELNLKKIVPEKIQQTTGISSFGVPTTTLVDKQLSDEDLKYNEKIQEEIDAQVSSSLEKLEAWAEHDFFTKKEYLRGITNTKTLTAYEELEDPDKQDLKEVFKRNILSAGGFGKSYFPGLNETHIDKVFEDAFANAKNSEKGEEQRKDIDIAIDEGNKKGISIDQNIDSLNSVMKSTYGKKPEQELALLLDFEEKIATGKIDGFFPEDKKNRKEELINQLFYKDELKTVFDPITKETRLVATGKRIPKDGGYKVFHDFNTGQNIQNPTERKAPTGTVDVTSAFEMYMSKYKNTSRGDLAKFNDRLLLEESGYNIEGDQIESVAINDKTLRGLLSEYKRPNSAIFDVPIKKLTELGYIANKWDFWSRDIFAPGADFDEIKPISYENKPYSNEQEFIEYLEVRNQQGLDIAAKKHALWQTYHLNRDVTSIEKTRTGQVLGAFSETVFGPEITEEQFGFTNQKTVDVFAQEIAPASGLELSEDQKRHTERTLGDQMYENVGSLGGLMVYLTPMGRTLKPATTAIARLNAPRYFMKGKQISSGNLIKFASKNRTSVENLVKAGAVVKKPASVWNKGKALALGATLEEFKMKEGLGALTDGRLEFERGVGAGFYLGGQLLPYSFKNATKYNPLNSFLEKAFKNAPAFVIAAEAGEAINAVVDDLQGREEFQTFVKKHWGDYDKNVERTILHLMTGFGLGFTHTKRFDFKRFSGIKNFKDQAIKKVIEKQDVLENQAKKEGVDITNEKAYGEWLDGQMAVGNKDLQKMERYHQDFLEADAYLEKINEVEEWTDPAKAKKHYEEHYKGLKDLYKSRGKELIVEVTNQPLYQEFFDTRGNLQRQEVSALFTRLSDIKDGTTTKNQAKIQINTSKSKGKQTASHEGLHAYMDLMFDGKPALKQNFANQLISVLSEVNLGTGIDLYSEILKDPALAGKKQLQLEELMTYTAEFLARKENRYLIQEGVVGKVADFFNNFSKSVTGKPADAFTHQDIINILGRYSAKGDYSKLKGLDRYVEIGENIEGQMARRPIETMKDQTKRLEASKKQIIQKITDLNIAKLENYKSEIADLQKELRENINPELNKINDIIKKGDPRDILNQFLSQKGSDGNFKNKYTKEEIKEGGIGRKDFNETAKLILESDFVKNMITTSTGELRFKKGGSNEQMFYEDVMSRIQERLEKNYDPKVNPDVFGWLTGVSGGRGESIIFRAKGDVMNEAKNTVKLVSKEVIEGFDNMFADNTGGGGSSSGEAPLVRKRFTETVEYKQEALDIIENAAARENIDVDGLSYKDVKNLVAGQTLINGRVPTSAKNVEATGPLKDILEVVGEKHGIPLERILANQTLTSGMRNKAREVIFKEVQQKIDALPEGTTPSGKSTGIANTKLGEFYVKGEAVKMAETGSRQGLAEQSKQNILKNDFLELFGIKPDGTMLGGTKFDGAIREYLKQEASIIANQAARQNAGNLSARIGEGRGIKMASRVFDNYMKAFPKSKPQDVFEAFFRAYYELPGNTKGQDNFFKTTKIVEGFESRDQQIEFGLIESFAVKSKDTQFNFAKSLKSLETTDITVKNGEVVTNKEIQDLSVKASRRVEDGNVVLDANQIRKNIQASSEVGQMINSVFPEFFNNKTLASQALFIHQRTTGQGITEETITKRLAKGKGEILTETGESVAGLDFTSGQKTVFENRKKKIDLSPEAEAQLKEIWKDADKIEFNSPNSQVTGQNKIREAVAQGKSQIEIDQIIEKYFSPVAEGSKAKYYDMLAKTLELYVKEAPNKQEFLNRAEYVFQGMRSNTNLRMGFRQLVPTLAVYAGKRTFNADQIKLEHLKVNAKQSFKAAELIVTGNWSRYGKETLKDFVGVLSPKELLDIIDAKGGKTNIETLYRLAILEPSILKEFVTVESKGKENLLDYVLREGKKQLSKDILRQALSLRTLKENNIKKLKEKGLIGKGEQIGFKQASKDIANHDAALNLGRKKKKTSRGGSFFDFDETLIDKGKNFIVATKGKETVRISSGQWPIEGPKYAAEGWSFDFKDFVNVRGGVEGPMFKKFKERLNKFGPEHMYVLTARPAESAEAIHGWLKSKGVEIPLKNITGLGNSTGEAKARWMLEKFAEGYNDMYFVDDALPNVKAVRDVLNQLDIKSDVQQALATRDLNLGINKIMEHSLGIDAVKRFSKAEAAIRGKNANRRKFFMPDTASDLELLLEPLYGKGKKGIENKKWFQDNFIRKWERGINDFNNARQAITNDYLTLRKNNKDVVKQLPEAVEGTNFTVDMAMRVYIWNKNGYTIPDLAPTTQKKLVSHIINNPKLQSYAENVAKLTKVEGGLKEPTVDWYAETIASEIQGLGEGVGRKKYIQDFIEAKNEIFTEANLNKMESKLGRNWRETIEDMFDRMETGRTRSMSIGKIGNKIMNYLNGSTGTIMNFNTRSASLQLISTVNFVNSSFNNPLMAAKAFANQPQYWKDFMKIMNSDMLKQRRQGLQINVSEVELANAAANSKNPARSAIAKILKAGYIPTKIADSFAISAGGATYYRNAINKYLKEGLPKAEAERKAFIDFQAIAERTQQSSRADLLSKQQTSFEGRLILPFANTPMQMNRIMIKDILDLSKGRYKGFYGENSMTSKLSRIGYYGFLQSVIFAGLQSGAFALMTNSDDNEKKAESKLNMLNTVADSFLRGMGIQGAVVNSLRLAVQEFFKQDAKKYNADYSEIAEKLLNVSPTVGSKFSKLDAAGNTYKYNKKVIKEEGLTLNGPLLEATTQVIESTTNAPLNRYYKKGNNIQNALDDNYYNWQRVLSGLGWSVWGLGPGKPDEERQLKSGRYLTKEGLRREQVKKSINQKNAKQKKSNKDPFRSGSRTNYFR
jgi:DNA repair protein RadC